MNTKKIFKIFFSPFFALLFLALTKIKFTPILGTQSKLSLGTFLGPTLAKIFGINYGTGIIILTHLIGLIFGIYKIKASKDFFVFFPIIFSGIYFAKIFKSEKKLISIPLLCIFFFILNPIGKQVWFYSGFWLIPILISLFKQKLDKILRIPLLGIFGYSLGATFVDHAIGSVIYLYFLKIPANFWIEAIPHAILERLLMAGGIAFFYVLEIVLIESLEKIPTLAKLKNIAFE